MSNNVKGRQSGGADGGGGGLNSSSNHKRHPRYRHTEDLLADESDTMPDSSLRRMISDRCDEANSEFAASQLLQTGSLGTDDDDDDEKKDNKSAKTGSSAGTVQHANRAAAKVSPARPQQRQLTDEEIKRNEKERMFGRSNTTGNAKPAPPPTKPAARAQTTGGGRPVSPARPQQRQLTDEEIKRNEKERMFGRSNTTGNAKPAPPPTKPAARAQTTGGGQHPSQRQFTKNEGTPRPQQQQKLTDEQTKQREKERQFRLSNTGGGGGGGAGGQNASQRQLADEDGTPPQLRKQQQRPLTDDEIKKQEKERQKQFGGPQTTSLGRTQTSGDDQPLRRSGSPVPPPTTSMGRTVTRGDAQPAVQRITRPKTTTSAGGGGGNSMDICQAQQAKTMSDKSMGDDSSMTNFLVRRSTEANAEIAQAERNILLQAAATGSTRAANDRDNMAAANIVLDEKRQSLSEKGGGGDEVETRPLPPTASAATEYSSEGTPVKTSLPAGSNRPGAYSGTPGLGYGRVASARTDGLGMVPQQDPSTRSHLSASASDRLVIGDNPAPALEQPPALDVGDAGDEEAPYHEEPHFDAPCEVAPGSDDDNNSKEELENTVQKYKTFLMIAGVVLLLVIIVAVVVPLVVSGGGNEETSTDAPTMAPDVEVDPSLIPNVPDSTWVKLFDKTSPQYKAYSWIVKDPMFDQYEDWRITQRFSLATFYYAMNGPRWENSWSWLNYTNECWWMNDDICHDDLKIYLLNITKQRGFKGKMPIEVTLLTNLEGIDFSHNVLGGDIAELFDNDFNHNALKVFWCSECRLGGSIPVEFAQMTALEGVILNNNDIAGELPSEMGQLQRLRVLEMDGNKFTGAIPSTIGNLQALSVLRLRDNLFSSLPSEVGKLTDMKVLYLGGNRFRQSIPSELGGLYKATLLDLDVGGFEGAIPSELGRLTNLQRLLLNRNKLSDSIPEEIGSLSNLQWLWMIDNKLVGSIPASIGNMTSLTKLDLGDNVLTSSIPSEIGLLLGLKELGLYKNELSGSIPSEIANLGQLETFDLADNPFLVQELPEEFCPRRPAKLKTDWCSGGSCCA